LKEVRVGPPGSILHFLNVARASSGEVDYLVRLTFDLDMLAKESFVVLAKMCSQLVPQLESLVQHVELLLLEERKAKRVKSRVVRAKA
jgi:hypothetical protein